MTDFIIFTDSNCDLPKNIIDNLKLQHISLTCNIENKQYPDDCGISLPSKDFYNYMRNGLMPTTSQVNAYSFIEKFEPYVKKDIPILYIAFSSSLSGTYNSSLIAKEELLEKYPNAKITIIDSLCASGGCGLLVYLAAELKQSGKSIDEVANWVELNKLNINHYFTVDDLNHLKRGGRISSTTAAIGSVLNIKPILSVDKEGKLIPAGKVKGRKKSMRTLVDNILSSTNPSDKQTLVIIHGDCLDDANYLANLLKDHFNIKNIIINNSGLAIGSHVGPGFLALFALGSERPN